MINEENVRFLIKIKQKRLGLWQKSENAAVKLNVMKIVK